MDLPGRGRYLRPRAPTRPQNPRRGIVFHCLNRGNARRELFADDVDYAAFERVLEAALAAVPVRL